MAFQKFSADQLFDGYQFHTGDNVLVLSDEGEVLDIVDKSEAGDDVIVRNGILSPGFINCHCHLELSHMKAAIEEGTGLVDFVYKIVSLRHSSEDEIRAAIEKAEDEMLQNGIVAVGDICNNTLTLDQKSKGRIYYHNFIEVSGFNPAIANERFNRSVEFFRAFSQYYSIPVESNSIVPHAPYSVAEELWQQLVHFPGNHLFTIHNQETEEEDILFATGEGGFRELYKKMGIDISFFQPSQKSSLQTFLPKFLHNQQLILVHNVHTTEKDIAFSRSVANSSQLYWCLCPNANLYISKRLPDISMLVNNDCPIILGTDSLASNHQLSILEEIKTIRQHFPQVETNTLLQWATSNGAKALQMDSILGSFEKGKRPGVVLIENDLSAVQRLA